VAYLGCVFPARRRHTSERTCVMAQIRYDEKGKFFTNFVSKNAVQAIVQTSRYRIRGEIHVRMGDRVKDELDRPEQFLAVTNASIYDENDTLLFEREFVSINRDHIIWVIPEQEDVVETGVLEEETGGIG